MPGTQGKKGRSKFQEPRASRPPSITEGSETVCDDRTRYTRPVRLGSVTCEEDRKLRVWALRAAHKAFNTMRVVRPTTSPKSFVVVKEYYLCSLHHDARRSRSRRDIDLAPDPRRAPTRLAATHPKKKCCAVEPSKRKSQTGVKNLVVPPESALESCLLQACVGIHRDARRVLVEMPVLCPEACTPPVGESCWVHRRHQRSPTEDEEEDQWPTEPRCEETKTETPQGKGKTSTKSEKQEETEEDEDKATHSVPAHVPRPPTRNRQGKNVP